MIVYWGLIAGSKPTRYRVKVNAPNAGEPQERDSEQGAKALAKQLAGGRADRVKRTTFPAAAAAAALAAPSKAATTAAVDAATPAAATGLVKGNAKTTIAGIESGGWDDALDAVEAAEQAREGGVRVTVIRAIEKRRAAE